VNTSDLTKWKLNSFSFYSNLPGQYERFMRESSGKQTCYSIFVTQDGLDEYNSGLLVRKGRKKIVVLLSTVVFSHSSFGVPTCWKAGIRYFVRGIDFLFSAAHKLLWGPTSLIIGYRGLLAAGDAGVPRLRKVELYLHIRPPGMMVN
jgi:hypothetical protein